MPLVQWFRAAWLVMSEKNGMSALGLQRQLGLSSYQTAWTMLHKFRTAMVRPGREKLHGEIEVDETYVGGPEPGRRGRQVRTKAIVAIGIETYPSLGNHVGGFGRIRMRMVPDVTQRTLGDFVWDIAEPGSVIKTDAWVGYQNIEGDGYTHVVANIAAHGDPAHVELPGVHRVASLLKRWLMGTHHGAVERQHLDSYLDEFTFRFNRRKAGRRGLLFYRLLQGAVTARPISYETIVWSRRGLALPPAERLYAPADSGRGRAVLVAAERAAAALDCLCEHVWPSDFLVLFPPALAELFEQRQKLGIGKLTGGLDPQVAYVLSHEPLAQNRQDTLITGDRKADRSLPRRISAVVVNVAQQRLSHIWRVDCDEAESEHSPIPHVLVGIVKTGQERGDDPLVRIRKRTILPPPVAQQFGSLCR